MELVLRLYFIELENKCYYFWNGRWDLMDNFRCLE